MSTYGNAALIERAEAADAADDAFSYTPRGRMARLRVERLFETELAAARHRNASPLLSTCPITGAKAVSFASIYPAPVAEPFDEGAGHEMALFDLGGALAGIDMPHYAALARAKAMQIQAEGWSARQLNAAAIDAALERRVECEGPQIDFEAQLTDPEFDPLAAPVGMFSDYWEGEADLRELCRSGTGRVLSVEAAEERFAAFRLQCEQTTRFATACEAAGMIVFCVDPSQVGQVGTEGRAVRPSLSFVPVGQPDKVVTLPNVQRLNAFPTVSASRRAADVRSLRWWMERHPYIRMATITAGTRFREDSKLGNLNAENKRLHRAIGELVRHRLFKAHARAVALGMEFGTPAPFMGDWHLHHHGHLLWEPVLPPATDWRRFRERIATTDANGEAIVCRDLRHPHARLARFRRWVRLRMAALMRGDWKERGFKWRERDRGIFAADEIHAELGKRIANAAEACKYPIKPQDLDVLLDEAGPAAVRTYVEQVKGLRLFTAYGEFKKLRARVKNEGRRFASVPTPDGSVIEICRNWNLSGSDALAARQRAARRAALRRKLSPAVTEKRRHKALRRVEARARRPLFRLYRIHQAEAAARSAIARGENVTSNTATLAALADEKAAHHLSVRELLENVPHALQAVGVSDLIAAPWLGDLRAFLNVSRAFSDASASAAHAADENAKKTIKKTVERAARRPVQNRVIARTAPFASGAWRIAQPALAVFGYTGDFAALRAQDKRVGELADANRDHIAACLRVQAALDALPPERAAAPASPAYNAHARHTRTHARVPRSHYPHNSQDDSASWPPTPDLWAAEARNEALAGAQN